jgi:hypothetical protein
VPLSEAKTGYVCTSPTPRAAQAVAIVRLTPIDGGAADDVPPLAGWRASVVPAIQHLRDVSGSIRIDRRGRPFTTQPPTTWRPSGLLGSDALIPGSPDFETQLPNLDIGIFPEGTPEFTAYLGTPTSPNIAAVAVGTFASYDFRTGPGGSFDPDKVSGATTPETNQLDFYLTIPKGTPPAAGWPITLFGHGLGQSGRDTFGIATALGDHPGMVIGISAVSHGRRGNFLDFFDFLHPFTTRDNFASGGHAQVVRWSGMPTRPRSTRWTSRIRYFGISLGGIMGTIFMGHAHEVQVGMLSVPGSPGQRSPAIGDLLQRCWRRASACRATIRSSRCCAGFINTSQWALDAGDPVNVARSSSIPIGAAACRSSARARGHRHGGAERDDGESGARRRLPDQGDRRLSGRGARSGIWRSSDRLRHGGHQRPPGDVRGPQALAQAKAYLESDGTEIIAADPENARARGSSADLLGCRVVRC